MGPRVASLLSSATEILCELGFRDLLVGISHECDYPPDITGLPVCTAPKFDTSGSSSEIDKRVKERLKGSPEEALSVYSVDSPLLQSLKPDLILTQSQCEVCAVSLKDVQRAVCSWISPDVKLISLEPHGLGDVWTDIQTVAQALDAADRGDRLVARLQTELGEIAASVSGHRRPSVVCIEWIDPLMAAGNWIPELIRIAGGENLLGIAGAHSPWMDWEDLIRCDPAVIVIAPCGFDLGRTREEVGLLMRNPAWHRLAAVRNRGVYIADGNQFFNRPGPRLVETTKILAEMFFPGVMKFGMEGSAWERVESHHR